MHPLINQKIKPFCCVVGDFITKDDKDFVVVALHTDDESVDLVEVGRDFVDEQMRRAAGFFETGKWGE